jgi:hypothetical protein
MKRLIKFVAAIIIYAFLLIILDYILGIGLKDHWEKLMKWSKK